MTNMKKEALLTNSSWSHLSVLHFILFCAGIDNIYGYGKRCVF